MGMFHYKSSILGTPIYGTPHILHSYLKYTKGYTLTTILVYSHMFSDTANELELIDLCFASDKI